MSSTDPKAWAVHKFGGSSVADADCFARVAAIIEQQPRARVAVVLSACKGVTDGLLELVQLAERQDPRWQQALETEQGALSRELASRTRAEVFATIRRALAEPLRWIAENAGERGYVVVSKVEELPAGHGLLPRGRARRAPAAPGPRHRRPRRGPYRPRAAATATTT